MSLGGQSPHGAGQKPRRFIASARTNLPDWPTLSWDATPEAVDVAGTGFVLVGLGPAAAPVIGAWRQGVGDRPCVLEVVATDLADTALCDRLAMALANTVVGWRLMLAGPAAEIMGLAAQARRAGMLDVEISLHPLDDSRVRVQCVHCKTLFRAMAGPGDIVICPGCGQNLLVHQHFSRRLGALVGFSADAEGVQ
ncbi:MAG: dimethylamine monooxygenase subunit DmmA family protein [Acetobacter sp.]